MIESRFSFEKKLSADGCRLERKRLACIERAARKDKRDGFAPVGPTAVAIQCCGFGPLNSTKHQFDLNYAFYANPRMSKMWRPGDV